MKKILLLAAAVMVSSGAFAQNFEWGIKAGLNLGSLTNMDMEDSNMMRAGLNAGLFGEYVINDFIGIQAELLYSMQGKGFKDGSNKMIFKLDYINLPVLAKLYILEGLSVDLGPQFGYMVSDKCKVETDGASVTIDMNKVEELGEVEIKKFDVSVGMGLSYKTRFGLDVFARYNLGLNTWIKANGSDEKSKNGVIQVGAGYRF